MFKPADEIRREVTRANEEHVIKEMECWVEKINTAIQSLREQSLEMGTTQGVSSFVNLDNIKNEEKELLFYELTRDGYKIMWNTFVGEYEISIP